jgi:hypothetical protein
MSTSAAMNAFTLLYGKGDLSLTINGHNIRVHSDIVCAHSPTLKMFHNRAKESTEIEPIQIFPMVRAHHIDALFYILYTYNGELKSQEYPNYLPPHGENMLQFRCAVLILCDYLGVDANITPEKAICASEYIRALTWVPPKILTRSAAREIISILHMMYKEAPLITYGNNGELLLHPSLTQMNSYFTMMTIKPEEDITPLYKRFFKGRTGPSPAFNVFREGTEEWITEEFLNIAAVGPVLKTMLPYLVDVSMLPASIKAAFMAPIFAEIDKNIRLPFIV